MVGQLSALQHANRFGGLLLHAPRRIVEQRLQIGDERRVFEFAVGAHRLDAHDLVGIAQSTAQERDRHFCRVAAEDRPHDPLAHAGIARSLTEGGLRAASSCASAPGGESANSARAIAALPRTSGEHRARRHRRHEHERRHSQHLAIELVRLLVPAERIDRRDLNRHRCDRSKGAPEMLLGVAAEADQAQTVDAERPDGVAGVVEVCLEQRHAGFELLGSPDSESRPRRGGVVRRGQECREAAVSQRALGFQAHDLP